EANGLGQALHRERRIGFELAIAPGARSAGGFQQMLRRRELGNQTEERCAHTPPCSCVCSSLRISEMEIAGRTRRNSRNSNANAPSEPASVATSQKVG